MPVPERSSGNRRLVVCAHWADDPNLDAVAAAMQPLKAEGTEGVAIAYAEDDPMAVKTYRAIKDAADKLDNAS